MSGGSKRLQKGVGVSKSGGSKYMVGDLRCETGVEKSG